MIYYEFFQNTFFLKKIASVTLHIPKEFWWHRIFGFYGELENFGPLEAEGGGGAR